LRKYWLGVSAVVLAFGMISGCAAIVVHKENQWAEAGERLSRGAMLAIGMSVYWLATWKVTAILIGLAIIVPGMIWLLTKRSGRPS